MAHARSVLISLRKDKNLIQKDVAKKLGITAGFYGMIEVGKRNPTLELAKRISDFFDVPIEDIFFNEIDNELLNNKQYS